MPAERVETMAELAADSPRTLNINVPLNDTVVFSCTPAVDTSLQYYPCSGSVALDVTKGDAVTFYLWGPGAGVGNPQRSIEGPNYVRFCGGTAEMSVFLPVLLR